MSNAHSRTGPEWSRTHSGTSTEVGPVTMAEAAQLLGVVPRTISKYREQGKVRGVREGKTWAIWVPRTLITLAHADHSGTHSGMDPERSGTGIAAGNPTPAEPVEATYRVDESALVTEAARQQLGSIRDEWLQPLIDRIAALEREGGRLEAERDAAREQLGELRRRAEAAEAERLAAEGERDALRLQLAEATVPPVVVVAAQDATEPPPATIPASTTAQGLWARLRRALGRT